MKNNRIYLMDKSLEIEHNNDIRKYIAKLYNERGEIQYYDEDDKEDGFSDIIKDLQTGKEVFLYTSNDKMKATLEFLNELKFSVEKAILTLAFKDKNNNWSKVKYEF